MALQATLGISISAVLAYLSYELFEKRFLSLKHRFETARDDGGADVLMKGQQVRAGTPVS